MYMGVGVRFVQANPLLIHHCSLISIYSVKYKSGFNRTRVKNDFVILINEPCLKFMD